jgi:hypothetical protein
MSEMWERAISPSMIYCSFFGRAITRGHLIQTLLGDHRHSGRIPASEALVAVKFNLTEPIVFLGSLAYIGASMNQSLAAGGVLEPLLSLSASSFLPSRATAAELQG